MNQTFLDKLLEYYHISYDDYLNLNKEVDWSYFTDTHHFEGVEKAAQIALDAVKNKEKIIIYGDYDCDGMLGTSILVKMFQYLGYEASFYIPSRYKDGYGINLENATKIKDKFDLIICVDNGIVANEAIDILKAANKKVLVIDHHTPQLPLPNADAIVHPQVSNYSELATSAGYCAFIFSYYVLGRIDKYLSILGMISVISDMMPLRDFNRYLLQKVFKEYKVGEFYPITLLSDSKSLDEGVVGSLLAPRINAIGRMVEDKNINLIVKYFTTDDEKFILTYFSYMIENNELRKAIHKEASDKILNNLNDDSMVSLVDVKEGLIGLIANSIVSKIKKPAIVFTYAKDDLLKGSARGVEGFNVVETFQKLSHHLEGFGGHSLAGGCSIKKENFEAFKRDFIDIVNNSTFEHVEKESIKISINDINVDNYHLIQSFAPFGINWEAPLLKLEGIKVSSLKYSKTHEHILTPIGTNSKLVGFYLGNEDLSSYQSINVLGQLSLSTYRGQTTIDFHIKSFEGK